MSEPRSANKHHHKPASTVFPSDFFADTRTSEPKQRYNIPKINVHKGVKVKSNINDVSPNKATIVSDSTSALSKENEGEDGVKFPEIRRNNNREGVKDFSFPFVPQSEKKRGKGKEFDNYRHNRISEGTITRSKALSPKKLFTQAYDTGNNSSQYSPLQPGLASGRDSISSLAKPSMNRENSMNKSKSLAKYSKEDLSHEYEGYDTDRLNSKRKDKMFSNKTSNNSMFAPSKSEYLPNNVLPVYDSGSDDEFSPFDPLSEDAFEEL